MTDEELATIKEQWQEGKATYGHDDPLLWFRLANRVPTLLAEIERLRAALEEARRLLRLVEWHSEGVYCGDSELTCPYCQAAATETPHFADGRRVKTDFRAEHDQDCPLAAFLGRRTVEWTETPG